MTTFFMFGKYTHDSIQDISADRTKQAEAVIKKNGGKFKDGFSLLGETDIVMIVEFPGIKEAMKTSVELSRLLGIGFTTAPAVSFEEFDKLVG